VSNQTLAVLVNQNDPESIEIAKYYQKARLVPDSNIIYLNFKPGLNVLTELEFKRINAQLKKQVKKDIQAYVLAWRKPMRVECMSITSAVSLGFSREYCAKLCGITKPVKYFNSNTRQPYTDYKIRPSMMLSALTLDGVKKLIDRGVEADYLRPNGTAYLLSTSDINRNVRASAYPGIEKKLKNLINIESTKSDAIKQADDVMFYFTGLERVRWVNDNNYLPGAIADHLTSNGGNLFNSNQMSVLEWIDAGVTGTYGTVVEPCNFVEKFPHPGIVMEKYLSGNSLIEAYWKSVKMPGQGVFVGEPLASPFRGCNVYKTRRGILQYISSAVDNLVEKKFRNCN